MEYQIIDLPREEWENTIVPIGYTTGEYYDITVEQKADGFVMGMKKQKFPPCHLIIQSLDAIFFLHSPLK